MRSDICLLCSMALAASNWFVSAERVWSIAKSDDMGSLLQTSRHVRQANTKEFVPVEKSNIVYLKVPKTGSSTAAGVNRRIAAHHNLTGVFTEGKWIANNGEPGVWSEHGCLIDSETDDACEREIGKPPSMSLIDKLQMRTFMWTLIREPAARAMSSYYWHRITQGGLEPTASSKIAYLSSLPQNFMFRYMRRSAHDSLEDVWRLFDLIGITERFDESLVALAAMLHIPLSDVLYISSKNSTAAMKDAFNRTMYAHPPIEEEPVVVQEYLMNEFRKANALDYQLYERAKQSLSEKVVDMRLQPLIVDFNRSLLEVQQACNPTDVSSDYLGHLATCYARDWGCNYECVDRKSRDIQSMK